MHLNALPLVFCGWLVAQGTALDNLDFSSGTLAGWSGQGFAVLAKDVKKNQANAVSSRDAGAEGRTGVLHRSLLVPADAEVIRCTACAVLAKDCAADGLLDIVLLTANNKVIPKEVHTTSGWQKVAHLLAGQESEPAEYLWRVAGYAGRTLRVVLVDQDVRPGCSIYCAGFQILTAEQLQAEEFSELMVRLAREHKLFPVLRYDSRHFMALSNADEGFSKSQLRNCEMLYSLFCEHFRRKGFAVQQPARRLMVAIFDSQEGFDAYLGRRMPQQVTGIYDPRTNRFVLYDYGQNQAFQAAKGQAERAGQQIPFSMGRPRYRETVERIANDFRTDANLSTIMHEVAHQMSFNTDLLNREGDVPAWLAEGLACYCESSSNGGWQGIGEPNPPRLKVLADCLRGQGQLLKLDDLLKSDQWLRGSTKTIFLGYAQSWALFHWLMEDRPQALKDYLSLIYLEKTAERRAANFQQVFGADLAQLERRYREHMTSLVQLHLPVQP